MGRQWIFRGEKQEACLPGAVGSWPGDGFIYALVVCICTAVDSLCTVLEGSGRKTPDLIQDNDNFRCPVLGMRQYMV